MFPLTGEDFLYVAGLTALVTALAGFAARNDGPCLRVARAGSHATALLLFISLAFLGAAFAQSDFSLQVVYMNSHTAKPLFYKIAALWGNHEGSILLWSFIASLYGTLFAFFSKKLPPRLASLTLGTQALLVCGFTAYVAFASNPFAPLFPVPHEGHGLNPILQDPALSFHPPTLYMGYVGFSLVFSLAIAGLIMREVNRAWAAAARIWALAAWSFLTLGIAMGSWWAYYELGWGGWWFWDPVENASLIPWLSATALIHSLVVVEKRGALKAWTVLLALITFTFCLIGTFLVRSGIITSVHAFALDPTRGVFILGLVGAIAGGGLLLFALRAHTLTPETDFAPLSRESLLVLNNIFLFTASITVLTGTLYPLLLDLLAGTPLSVGPPYFEATVVPLMMPVIFLMGFAGTTAWQRDKAQRIWPHVKTPALASAALLLIIWMLEEQASLRFYLGMALAGWLFFTSFFHALKERKLSPMVLAHAGLAVSLFGMVASSTLTIDKVELMKPGQELTLSDYVFRFEDISRVEGSNYMAERARFSVKAPHGNALLLYPERRLYPVTEKILSNVAISTNGIRDLYLVLGDAQKDESGAMLGWNVRAYYTPMVPWIWFGCGLMAAGGLLALMRKRKL